MPLCRPRRSFRPGTSRTVTLPDKAIDLIDEAGARLRIKRLTAPPELKELDAKIARISADKDKAIKDQDFEKAAELRDSQEKLSRSASRRSRHGVRANPTSRWWWMRMSSRR